MRKKYRGNAIIITEGYGYCVRDFTHETKSVNYNKNSYIINRKDLFYLKGKNPFISRTKSFFTPQKYLLFFDSSKNFSTINNKKYIRPLSFSEEVQNQKYTKISPLFLKNLAIQKNLTALIKSIAKIDIKFPRWIKYTVIGIVIVLCVFFSIILLPIFS